MPPLTAIDADGAPGLVVRRLGRREYEPVWREMQSFTAARGPETPDELWTLEHPPVYTLGVAARPEHLPRRDTGIPVVRTDRGGQITYHGPGQLVVYVLLDLRRRRLGVRPLVRKLEQAVIELLGEHGIHASGREDAPGVYVGESKVAALGLRIRNGCTYHGLSLNVDMDLSPFDAIDPCGYRGLRVTTLRELGLEGDTAEIAEALTARLAAQLGDRRE